MRAAPQIGVNFCFAFARIIVEIADGVEAKVGCASRDNL
jgi:hypothetical protein